MTAPNGTRTAAPALSAPAHAHVHLPWWMWITPCIWSGAFLTGAAALHRLSPVTVTFLRFALASIGGAILLHRPIAATLRAKPRPRQWLAMLALALLGGVAYHIAFYAGLARTQPPVASVIIATNPILTTLAAALFLRDHRPTRALFVGLALAFAGATLLAMDKPTPEGASLGFVERLTHGWGSGETLCLVASISWAAYAVLLQHFRSGVLFGLPSAGVTFLVYGLTFALLMPLVATGGWDEIVTMDAVEWGCMLYIGIAATVIAYTLYNAAIDRAGSSRVSQITYAVPALTTLLTLAFYKSFAPTELTWFGLVLVTLGLVVSDGRVLRALAARAVTIRGRRTPP